MRLPKQTFTVALDDLRKLALEYAQAKSLDHVKNYSATKTTENETAHLAGQVAGVIEFLSYAKTHSDRFYQMSVPETD